MKIIRALSEDTVLADVALPLIIVVEYVGIPPEETHGGIHYARGTTYLYRGEHDDGFVYEKTTSEV